MKITLFCVFFFATAWAFPKAENKLQFKRLHVDPMVGKRPEDINGRITHGKEVVPHSIPYQAYLIIASRVGNRWLCGGSLISPKHILTAGHCLHEGVSAVIYLGAHNLLEAESSRIVLQSTNLIRHEDYNSDKISDDIGVIVLDEPVELNDEINTVALPTRQIVSDFEGENARVSGWGRVTGAGSTSPVLLEVNSTVISNELCGSVYSIVIDSQLCISGSGGVGSCSGDSGGPLVLDNTQIGIVSYGAAGCPYGYPSAFTRVTSYLDWLEEKTGLKLH